MKISKHRAGPGGGLRELLAVARRRRWTLLAVPVLVTGTAAGLSGLQPRVYRATAEVLVTPVSPAPAGSQSAAPLNTATEASLASSHDVASAAAARLGLPSSQDDDLLGGLTVTPDESNAAVLGIAYTSSDPREAQLRAQAFADGYLEVRRQQALDDLATSAHATQGQIVALQSRLQGIDAEIAAAPSATRRQSLQSAEFSMVGELLGLQGTLVNLTAPQSTPLAVGQVLLPAALPGVPVKPIPLRNDLMAIVVGLVLATGTAFLRERLDDRVWDPALVEAELGAPLLAALPGGGARWRPHRGGPPLPALEPGSPPAEAYRKLRAGLSAATAGGGTTTLMVASAEGEADAEGNGKGGLGQGRTAVTTNLAAAFSLAGRRVAAAPLEPVATERFLTGLKGGADLVLIDAPAILGTGDAAALAPMADGLLFVAVAGRTRRRALGQARRVLDAQGANVIGCVLTNVQAGRSRPGW